MDSITVTELSPGFPPGSHLPCVSPGEAVARLSGALSPPWASQGQDHELVVQGASCCSRCFTRFAPFGLARRSGRAGLVPSAVFCRWGPGGTPSSAPQEPCCPFRTHSADRSLPWMQESEAARLCRQGSG